MPCLMSLLVLCRARMGDITALFNLPKKVAAGSGATAAELEQQLQKAQDQARRERERAQQLEQEMKVCAAVCALAANQTCVAQLWLSKIRMLGHCSCPLLLALTAQGVPLCWAT